MSLAKLFLYFAVFVFSSTLFATGETTTSGDTTGNVTTEALKQADKHYHTDREDRLEREAEQREREDARLKREAEKAAHQAEKDAVKSAQEQCKQAHEDVKREVEDKQSEKEKWEDKFYDLEEKITDLESKNAEEQTQITTELDELKQESNRIIQDLKEEMGRELKGIEGEVKALEAEINRLVEDLRKREDMRLDAFYARRKQQNEMYSSCFTKALEQTEAARGNFYQRAASNTLKRQNLKGLMSGGRRQTKTSFTNKFNSLLHLCLNNQAMLLQKKTQADEDQLLTTKLNRQDKYTKQKIEEIKQQILNLQTPRRKEIMTKFKEKMEAEVNRFSQTYDILTGNYQKGSQQILAEIQKVKQKQAMTLNNRAQAVPQQTRSVLISQQCNSMDTFNLFPQSQQRGIFNSSPSSSVQRGSIQ